MEVEAHKSSKLTRALDFPSSPIDCSTGSIIQSTGKQAHALRANETSVSLLTLFAGAAISTGLLIFFVDFLVQVLPSFLFGIYVL